MTSAQISRVAVVAMLLISGVLAGAALAQGPPPMATTPDVPVQGSGWIAASLLVLGLLVAIGVAVKFYDLRRKREAEAVHIQAQISDAFLRDPNLFGLPVAATARAPLLKGSPVTVEITGEISDPSLHETMLRIARAEAQRIRPDVEILDMTYVRQRARVA